MQPSPDTLAAHIKCQSIFLCLLQCDTQQRWQTQRDRSASVQSRRSERHRRQQQSVDPRWNTPSAPRLVIVWKARRLIKAASSESRFTDAYVFTRATSADVIWSLTDQSDSVCHIRSEEQIWFCCWLNINWDLHIHIISQTFQIYKQQSFKAKQTKSAPY